MARAHAQRTAKCSSFVLEPQLLHLIDSAAGIDLQHSARTRSIMSNTARAGILSPARVAAVGTSEGEHLALLATLQAVSGSPMFGDARSNDERYASDTSASANVSAHPASIVDRQAGSVSADVKHLRNSPSMRRDDELAARVLKAVVDAAARDAESLKELQLAVASFTAAFRDMGTSPEEVLIALKAVINNRSLLPIPLRDSDRSGEILRAQISTWCIEEFFNSRSE